MRPAAIHHWSEHQPFSARPRRADIVDVGETALDFTVPLVDGETYNDLERFTLSGALGKGPVVLVFYPAALTSECTEEMCAFRDSMDAFDELNAQVYGISVDLPFAQNIWGMVYDLGFPMLSDGSHDVIRRFDVVNEDMSGMIETAERSVFVLGDEGVVTSNRSERVTTRTSRSSWSGFETRSRPRETDLSPDTGDGTSEYTRDRSDRRGTSAVRVHQSI